MGTEFRQMEDRHGVVVGGRGERVGGTGGMGMKSGYMGEHDGDGCNGWRWQGWVVWEWSRSMRECNGNGGGGWQS